jgi:hypothetical protein
MTMKIVYREAGPLLDYWVAMASSITPTAPSCSACASADTTTPWASWYRSRRARSSRPPAGATAARLSSVSTLTWSATSAAGWRGTARHGTASVTIQPGRCVAAGRGDVGLPRLGIRRRGAGAGHVAASAPSRPMRQSGSAATAPPNARHRDHYHDKHDCAETVLVEHLTAAASTLILVPMY